MYWFRFLFLFPNLLAGRSTKPLTSYPISEGLKQSTLPPPNQVQPQKWVPLPSPTLVTSPPTQRRWMNSPSPLSPSLMHRQNVASPSPMSPRSLPSSPSTQMRGRPMSPPSHRIRGLAMSPESRALPTSPPTRSKGLGLFLRQQQQHASDVEDEDTKPHHSNLDALTVRAVSASPPTIRRIQVNSPGGASRGTTTMSLCVMCLPSPACARWNVLLVAY